MSESNGFKDYSDYFAKLESSLNREKSDNQQKNKIARSYGEKPVVKKGRQNKRAVRKPALFMISSLLVLAIIMGVVFIGIKKAAPEKTENKTANSAINKEDEISETFDNSAFWAAADNETAEIPSTINSKGVIFINTSENKVVAERNSNKKFYPASTTKIMTLLVAAEKITDMKDTFTFSYEITDPLYLSEATMAGFANGEEVNMTDLLYGAILPSGADATTAIAIKVGGSEEGFVALMNEKAEALGLKNTHFANASGLFDKNHYTTPCDMAVVLRAAMENELCRRILSTYKYTTSKTPQHKDGIELTSTLFSYMYGSEPDGATILGGKTGYTGESGYCIASFGKSDTGSQYVCVAFNAPTRWPAVYDQIGLFSAFAK